MPYVPDRLAEFPGLLDRVKALDEASARRIYSEIWRQDIDEPPEFVDLSPVSSEDGTHVLRSIGVPSTSAIWLSYAGEPKTVLAMDWSTFVDHWDDFWYPSSDDVRVVTSESELWMIQIDHEEELRVIRRPAQSSI